MLEARRAARLVVLAGATATAEAKAVDRFEIQVYDGAMNAPGVTSLENHVSFTDRGRRTGSGPEDPTHHQAHWTFEGALGVSPIWEPGLYLQTALVPGRGYVYAGAKVRSKLMAPRMLRGRLRLGANFELADVPRRFESDEWSVEIRPIAALDLPALRAAVNPILGVPLAHGGYRHGPHFEPAISVKAVLAPTVALGFEYYGGLGPLGALDPVAEQEHYLFGAGDYRLGAGFDLNLGVGYGFGSASDRLTLKAIVAYEFGRVW